MLCFTNLARERLAGNRAPADASTGVLFFTNLAQWRRAGNRAPIGWIDRKYCVH